ncbi:IS110 family transposase [Micromonospora sp. D93]|uniref:IS110 family transposase n=1 Tax=Micromonospora sp. D93 TaxID=2824886 RepID=UPI0021131F0D|nr:IS110 family transposase [Micromonospora sp. D93]
MGEIITSLPGIGTTLAAEFFAHAGTLTTYPSPAALAAHAGLAAISRDSSRRQGHQVRPHRYHRGLRRVFSMSSFAALTHCPRARVTPADRRSQTGVRVLRVCSWAGRTEVRATWVNGGHSLPPQVNPRSLD